MGQDFLGGEARRVYILSRDTATPGVRLSTYNVPMDASRENATSADVHSRSTPVLTLILSEAGELHGRQNRVRPTNWCDALKSHETIVIVNTEDVSANDAVVVVAFLYDRKRKTYYVYCEKCRGDVAGPYDSVLEADAAAAKHRDENLHSAMIS